MATARSAPIAATRPRAAGSPPSLGFAFAMLVAIAAFNACGRSVPAVSGPRTVIRRASTRRSTASSRRASSRTRPTTRCCPARRSSRTRATATIGRACGGTGLNVAMPALTASEQALIVCAPRWRRSRSRARSSSSISTRSQARPTSAIRSRDHCRPISTIAIPLNDLPVPAVVGRARQVVADRRQATRAERFRSDPDAPWWWADEKRFARGRGRASDSTRATSTRSSSSRARPRRDAGRASGRNLLPLFSAHPRRSSSWSGRPTRSSCGPTSSSARQLDVSLDFKRWVFETTRELPNVRIVDLQGVAEVTHDLDRYTDLYHFAPDDQRMAGRGGLRRAPSRAARQRRCTRARPPRARRGPSIRPRSAAH